MLDSSGLLEANDQMDVPTSTSLENGGPTKVSPTQSVPSAPARPKRSWSRFFRDVFLYLLIYVMVAGLSIGPLFWTWFGAVYVDGPKWFARLYQPLVILCEIIPPLSWVINAWINWWIL